MIEIASALSGGGVVLLTIAVIILVRALTSGMTDQRASFASEVLAGKAQIAAERNQLEAEKQRDAARELKALAENLLAIANNKQAALGSALDAANKRLAELQAKEINDAEGAALVDVSHGVLGPHVSASGATGDTAAGGSGSEGAGVHGPGPASGR